jgi:hypothetical protein
LTAAGPILQSAGLVTASSLAATGIGGISLANANKVGALAGLSNAGAGGIAFTDTVALDVTVPIAAGSGGLALTTLGAGSNLSLAGDLTAGGAIALSSSGVMTQTSGTISGASLTFASVGGASLTRVKLVTLAGGVNLQGGDILVQDQGDLAISGLFNNLTGNVTLQATGTVQLQAPTINALDLILVTAGGTLSLADGRYNAKRIIFSSKTQFTQTGTTNFDPEIVVVDVTGAPLASLTNIPETAAVASLSNFTTGADSGAIHLGNFSAPFANVMFMTNSGNITGNINAAQFGIAGRSGSADLSGTIGGVAGAAAAQLAFKTGDRDNAYRFNDCAINNATCIALPQVAPILPRGATDIVIVEPVQQFDDVTLQRLNFGDDDLF